MTADEQISEAEQAHDELRAALTAAGVKLPSLALDVTTFAGAAPFVLIDLGRCNVATARSLADALREKAER